MTYIQNLLYAFVRFYSHVIPMPDTKWKQFMEDPKKFSERQRLKFKDRYKDLNRQYQEEREQNREKRMRCDIRKRARACIEHLVFIVSHMRNVSSAPEKEFARIFTDDTEDAFSLIGKARLDGLFGTPSIGDGQAFQLYGALNVARIESDLLRLQRDPEYRKEMHLKLLDTPNYAVLRSVSLDLEIIRSDREVGKLTIPGPARSDDQLERALGHLAPKEG
jgi:hypothetical protein